MKICVVGLGSIAKRHIKNIKELYEDVEIDILRHGDKDEPEYGNNVYSYEDLADEYDAVFITNPTTMHIDTLNKLMDKADAFFIEKPLRPTDCREDSIDSLPGDKVFYVACPLRYTGIIKYLKQNIDWNRVYSLRAMSSSFLPEWRPGTDYTKCYSARKDLGGGVAADLIHEWDYISYLIGKPDRVYTVRKKISKLDIDVEDVALYIGEYKDKVVEVHLDYFGRKTLRDLYIFMQDDTVYCDLVNNTITYMKQDKVIEFGEERDDYQIAELKHFFDIVSGKIDNDNSAYEAERLMRLLEN
ncbi:MAG: Gfo/Idh/MocA family oxidoreductase [Lachnospiraceae bacterium]|nr:Gfo/Idh/MocA family oxidoreductase [Lachnospiraceae bacterium]